MLYTRRRRRRIRAWSAADDIYRLQAGVYHLRAAAVDVVQTTDAVLVGNYFSRRKRCEGYRLEKSQSFGRTFKAYVRNEEKLKRSST